MQADSLPSEPPGKPENTTLVTLKDSAEGYILLYFPTWSLAVLKYYWLSVAGAGMEKGCQGVTWGCPGGTQKSERGIKEELSERVHSVHSFRFIRWVTSERSWVLHGMNSLHPSILFNFVNSSSRCLYSLILPLSTDLTIYCCSIAKSCLTLCDPMDCSTPGFPVLHYLLGFVQTHVHWVNDAIQPYYPLSPLVLLPSLFPSIRVFSSESPLHIRWLKYWSLSISPSNEYSGSFRIDWIDLLAVQGTFRPCHP